MRQPFLQHCSLVGFVLIWVFAAFDASAVTKLRIVAFGDSIMSGYGLSDPNDALPAKLSQYIPHANNRVEMIPMAVAGDTSSGALARVPDVLAQKPDLVILAVGGNDLLRGIDPDVTYNNLEVMLKQFERSGVYTLLCGMKAPPSMGYDYATRFDRIYPKLAERHNITFYPFLLQGVIGNRLYLQRDGIHPSKEGVQVITNKMAPVLSEMLSQLKRSRGQAANMKPKKTRRAAQSDPMEPPAADDVP